MFLLLFSCSGAAPLHTDLKNKHLCSMDYGEWTENSRGTYNKWDGVARSTVQVLNKIFRLLLHPIIPFEKLNH